MVFADHGRRKRGIFSASPPYSNLSFVFAVSIVILRPNPSSAGFSLWGLDPCKIEPPQAEACATGKILRPKFTRSSWHPIRLLWCRASSETCNGDCTRGPLINPQVFGFNYDVAAGVDSQIDLTQPVGERIRNLRWQGQPLADDQPLRIAVNSYRAGGSAGYSMFHGAG